MTCWRGERRDCKARWIVCDSGLEDEAGDLLDAYSEIAVNNVNVRTINEGELVRYAYLNDKGAGFILEIDSSIFDPDCLAPIKSDLIDKLTQALYGDPRWQLLYHIIERQMLPTP